MSAIFYRGDDQRQLAETSRDEAVVELGRQIYTELQPLERFYLAEDYHQKYMLRRSPEAVAELTNLYGGAALVDSTAAARLNGFLGGHGDREALEREITKLGLSSRSAGILLRTR